MFVSIYCVLVVYVVVNFRGFVSGGGFVRVSGLVLVCLGGHYFVFLCVVCVLLVGLFVLF